MSIERLDPRHQADVNAVAELHETYLRDSPVAQMGPQFVRRFYYRKLIEAGLIECDVCRADGRIVGFLSYTTQPGDFMMRGIRRYFFSLVWTTLVSLATSPGRIRDLLLVARIMRQRGRESRHGVMSGMGEGISMAVLPQYERHVPAGGDSRVTIRLFENMAQRLREQGVRRIMFMVQPTNLAANLFYSSLGCRLEKVVHASIAVHRYTYCLD